MQTKKSGRRGWVRKTPGRWKKLGDYFFLSGITLPKDFPLPRLLDSFLVAMCFPLESVTETAVVVLICKSGAGLQVKVRAAVMADTSSRHRTARRREIPRCARDDNKFCGRF